MDWLLRNRKIAKRQTDQKTKQNQAKRERTEVGLKQIYRQGETKQNILSPQKQRQNQKKKWSDDPQPCSGFTSGRNKNNRFTTQDRRVLVLKTANRKKKQRKNNNTRTVLQTRDKRQQQPSKTHVVVA